MRLCQLKVSHCWLRAHKLNCQTGSLLFQQSENARQALRRANSNSRDSCSLSKTGLTRMSTKRTILWFRKGLRLHDNPALKAACQDAEYLHPIFIIDPWFMQPEKVGVNRVRFLLDCLMDLDISLRTLGSQLFVLQGTPEKVLPSLFQEWKIDRLCFEFDTEPYARQRDDKVVQVAKQAGVEVMHPVSHTLYDSEWLVHKAGGKAPLTFQSFQKLLAEVGPPPAALDPPAEVPPPIPNAWSLVAGSNKGPAVPTLEDVGYPNPGLAPILVGGESQGLALMTKVLDRKEWVAKFEKPSTAPTEFNPPSTTRLSPYLKFGCVSVRRFHAALVAIYRANSNSSKPPVSLEGQVLWREFYYTVAADTPNYDRVEGNAICRQIAWDNNPEYLAAWAEGRTGYPWIDAAMTQLRTQGWLHHLARHAVACFLTRGDLYLSWERGAEVFDRYLLDADWALNNGNWMWLSASCFFSQYFRVYGPVSFGKKYDPEGKYIRHFLPVLKDMPKKYIYEPWKAPVEVQRKAKCVVGKDYPKPIVDHDVIHKTNIGRMAQAYKEHKEVSAPSATASPAKKQKR